MNDSYHVVLWIVVWIIVFCAFIGLFANAYGEDYYRTLGVYHKFNPEICVMLPDQEIEPRVEMISNMTKSAIDEWQFKLINATGGNWQMNVEWFVWSEHFDKTIEDYPSCTIFINYPLVTDGSSVGRTGFDFSTSSSYYYWIEIDTNDYESKTTINLGESMNSTTITNVKNIIPLPATDIRNIALHELGHGLGMEHYYVETDCRFEDCDYSSIMYGTMKLFIDEPKYVTDKDIQSMIVIYGEDGFGNHTPPYIPREFTVE